MSRGPKSRPPGDTRRRTAVGYAVAPRPHADRGDAHGGDVHGGHAQRGDRAETIASAPPAGARHDVRPPPSTAPGERVVYGAGPVRELLARKPSAIRALWVDPHRAGRATTDPVAEIVVAARAAGLRIDDVDRRALERAAGEGARHQGVIAWLGPFVYADLDVLAATPHPQLLVALDGVEDPRNLGAILRSAYLLGAGGVIIPSHRAAQVTPLVSKASAGASELLPIAQVGNLVRALEELRERGLWRVAIHADPIARPIEELDATLPLCLVLGAEGAGVRPLVASSCDFHAIIPMAASGVGSFNVSVAAAISLYDLARRRRKET